MPKPAPAIAVLSPHRHPRLRYVLHEIGADLGYRFRLFTREEQWLAAESEARVVYGQPKLSPEAPPYVAWPAHPFMSGAAPGAKDLVPVQDGDLPVFFPVVGPLGMEGYDLLACIFYQLSRYEEYQDFVSDAHGRFPATASLAYRAGFLERPVVREWACALRTELRQVFPGLPERVEPMILRPTYDIDIPWAWQHRGWRGVAAGLRDVLTGHWRRAWQRFTTAADDDPFATLPFIFSLHLRQRPTDKIQLFWLLADNGSRHDPNPYPIPAAQVHLLQNVPAAVTHGIHPSYRSSTDPALLREETERLARILGHRVQHARQHFLRFRLPDTYRQLRLAGITHEYSMGYADAVGWRAGTNLPFFWYDLEREEATGLSVHPFAAMDVTLKNYLGLNATDAREKVLSLAQKVRPHGGDFALLWHNSSFAESYGWAGWSEMYVGIINDLS
ncbi:polysaccharide deacetylase family protein [Neolewinella lacunae]|uniref:Polysaccharide deacetylase family protein n=1 Tax=Neolewinella lacunae TaxID=1517758 RepID=A0A923PQM9_9BACT|nr:polysaccharide deacetylase family protein [Neolewinella lacunae]MBC6996001.1 polysaccharide deacetylase family protein [Neolewinella lacunae]MDN3633175.1 polysaccharide deacetylase family protein [Neolewinella lacunae]